MKLIPAAIAASMLLVACPILAGEATIPARAWHAMAWHGPSERIVLFGGLNEAGPLGDTWAWDGAAWEQVAAATDGPPPRSFHAMASDPIRGRVVLFGGLDEEWGRLGDTWEWDGTRWEEVTTTGPAPSPRAGHAMAWDPASGLILLFGGRDSDDEDARRSAAIWLWDGETWSRTAAPGPPGRSGHALATDPIRGLVVLFGGMDPASTRDDAGWSTTWEWSGGSWRALPPGRTPSARSGHALGWEGNRQRLILFGGRNDEAGNLPGAWEWDGKEWQRADGQRAPSPRTGHAMEWDPVRERLILFGGTDEGEPEQFFAETWGLGSRPARNNESGPGRDPEPEEN